MKKKYIIIIASYLVLVMSAYSVMFLKTTGSSSGSNGSEKERVILNYDRGLEHIKDTYTQNFRADKKYQLIDENADQKLGDVAVLFESHLKLLAADEYAKEKVATDNVILNVSKKNPVTDLTETQIKDILSGRLNSWKSLTGKDERIMVVADWNTYNYLAERFDDISAVDFISDFDINYYIKDDEYMIQIVHASLSSSENKALIVDNVSPDDYENYLFQDPVILAYNKKYTDMFKNIDLTR